MTKNMMVNIWPPVWIPKIFAHAAGKVEKCPPSHVNAKATINVYKPGESMHDAIVQDVMSWTISSDVYIFLNPNLSYRVAQTKRDEPLKTLPIAPATVRTLSFKCPWATAL